MSISSERQREEEMSEILGRGENPWIPRASPSVKGNLLIQDDAVLWNSPFFPGVSQTLLFLPNMIWVPFFFSQYQCSGICRSSLPLVCVVLTFKCHFRCVEAAWCYWMNLMRSLSIPESKTVVGRDTSVFPLLPPLNWLCRRKAQKVICLMFSIGSQLEKGRRQNQAQAVQHPDCAEPGIVSQRSIHGWTLWHLICSADETLPFLNWSGFVSSQLSHDPLLYGSVRGGGIPLEDPVLVGLLFASCCSTERMLRLKLFYAWLNSLFYSSASYLQLFSLSPSVFQFRPFLKPLMQEERRKHLLECEGAMSIEDGPWLNK